MAGSDKHGMDEERGMDLSKLTNRYHVRLLDRTDIETILSLCRKNSLYYQFCPPAASEQTIIHDMEALPPNKDLSDKYYFGFFEDDSLIAVMDLIAAFPDEKTAFIGFFMTDTSVQNRGIGSKIIEELCSFLRTTGFSRVRLGWVKGNPQAQHFWHKCGFAETGVSYDTGAYTVIVAQRAI